MSLAQPEWLSTGSTERPITFTPRRSNSGLILAMYPSSVVQTGVKSFGCEKSTAQESPIQSWKRIGPSVVCASKSGAVSPSCNAIVPSLNAVRESVFPGVGFAWMATEQAQGVADVREARDRLVPRGIATTDVVVTRAEGATLCDADGNELLDFAGGIACQNLGHNAEAVVRAVHEQVDRYLHQCFMVGMYEPYVEVARRLDELWPGDNATKTVLVNSGAEAIENAVKIARAATKRPAVVVFDRAFHGRTNLTM